MAVSTLIANPTALQYFERSGVENSFKKYGEM
jgi:hypothetical protein